MKPPSNIKMLISTQAINTTKKQLCTTIRILIWRHSTITKISHQICSIQLSCRHKNKCYFFLVLKWEQSSQNKTSTLCKQSEIHISKIHQSLMVEMRNTSWLGTQLIAIFTKTRTINNNKFSNLRAKLV